MGVITCFLLRFGANKRGGPCEEGEFEDLRHSILSIPYSNKPQGILNIYSPLHIVVVKSPPFVRPGGRSMMKSFRWSKSADPELL